MEILRQLVRKRPKFDATNWNHKRENNEEAQKGTDRSSPAVRHHDISNMLSFMSRVLSTSEKGGTPPRKSAWQVCGTDKNNIRFLSDLHARAAKDRTGSPRPYRNNDPCGISVAPLPVTPVVLLSSNICISRTCADSGCSNVCII